MLLTEFIQKTTAYTQEDLNDASNPRREWVVEIPIAESPKPGKVFVDQCASEYEAKERAFLYLQDYFNDKRN